MATDLAGKSIGDANAPEFALSLQQKRQATLLYHWMSLEYLKHLKVMIDALVSGADVNLALAEHQGRDALLANARWGVRDTAANWSTYGFSALQDFRLSTQRLIAWRATEEYCGTGAYQCARMLSEHSSLWMSPKEEEAFKTHFEAVVRYAQRIDHAAGVGGLRHQLHDHSMALLWQEFGELFPRLPKYRVRTDIEGRSRERPPRTGVYVAPDDPYATLQFAWTGNADGVLGEAQTLSAAGRRAMAVIGRDAMWVDGAKMAAYAVEAFRRGELTERDWYKPGDEADPDKAPWIIGTSAFEARPCKWFFVERVEGEFDDEADASAAPAQASPAMRCEAGQPCPREGWWSTPAKAGSRRWFAAGEVMPALGGDYGATIWQMEGDQRG